eukprot:CAMPEP_0168409136 /NCGR_PEP_ID=MMETSP0228-20121227/27031_1 /TAXON_ID=133427 /ORGANISM="Protoceratium reticulatum, Strain CCCM 535 (=CCMP 1889)" /LENGTH=205 /DNA_ID=CAMNT_0008422845 /DNA_START=61 /DNA_END=678 /DNA_ORIENTATION=-
MAATPAKQQEHHPLSKPPEKPFKDWGTASNLAIVPKTDVSENRLCLLQGDTDKDGYYSVNGQLRRRAPTLAKGEQVDRFGRVQKTQQQFMQHVQEGRLDRIEDMLEFQRDELDLNFQDDKKGFTALMHATCANKLDIVMVLLEARADPHLRDRTPMRYTPLEVATVIMQDEDADFEDVVEVLREACAYDNLPKVRRKPEEGNGDF